jgi:anaerobic selenocysteine-containing dehydrogenase
MDSMSSRFFHKLGASMLYRSAMCGGVKSQAWAGTYGNVPGIPPEMAEGARLNVLWGNNATVTNLHLVRRIRRSLRNGGKLLVIDPKQTKIAAQADLHLQPQPGTDVLLAWAMAVEFERTGALDAGFVEENVLGYAEFMALARQWPVERAAEACGVPARDILTASRWMAEADPLVMAPGVGLERSRNGGSAIRAVIALPALLGKLGSGSGCVMGAGHVFPKTPAKLQRPDLAPPGTRTINILDVGRHLAEDDIDPPVRAVFVYNHNPVVVHPSQARMRRGLMREDIFMVGIDVAMTESMALCDIVLPAATHFEIDDIYASYGQHWLQRAEPVIPPQGESLPNTEIFRLLARRFGFNAPCFSATDREMMDDAFDAGDVRLGGAVASTIAPDHAVQMRSASGETFVLYDNIRPATPSGKIELLSETLAQRWGEHARLPRYLPPEETYPLALITPASDRTISSTLGNLRKTPVLDMNPDDAAARGLRSGQMVRIWNTLGEVVLPVAVSTTVPPGVVASEKGAWLSSSPTGMTVSALVSADARADLADAACFNDGRVEVAAA